MKENKKDLEMNFNEIINMIETRRNNAYRKVNEELISLYWDFGKYISEKVNDSNWGDKIVDKLVDFMKREYPTLKGFNRAGIYRMKQFYETYKDNEIVAPLVRQISWSHNVMILGATNSMEEKEFYIKMCVKNNYSKRELDRQISSGYYQRYMLSDGKANQSLLKVEGEDDYPNTRLLDTYSLEFLDLPENIEGKESVLETALINNLQKFLLELGKGFSFVARQFRISTETDHFYADLVFYNYLLKCFVVIDLKTTKLSHADIGQMDMYVRMYDELKRTEGDNPTIGLILCSRTSEDMARYSMLKDNDRLFQAKYLTFLPTKEELTTEIERQKMIFRLQQENNTPEE